MFFQCRQKQKSMPLHTKTACMKTGCDKKTLECDSRAHGQVFLSFHCRDHACRQRLGEIMCPNPKDPASSRFCSDHRRCQAESCDLPRKFADLHSTFAYCQKHTCFLDGCNLKRAALSEMCSVHTPICLIPDCSEPRSSTGFYCTSHSCVDKDCDNVISGGSFCKSHKACAVRDCSEAKVVKTDAVCQGHKSKQCSATGCANRIPVEDNRSLCSAHECAVESCHGPKRNPDNRTELYCLDHTCKTAYCTRPTTERGPLSSYCLVHGCSMTLCLHPRDPDIDLCARHRCRAPGCTKSRHPDSVHCDTHMCSASGCPIQRTSEGAPGCAVHNLLMLRYDSAMPPGYRPEHPSEGPGYASAAEEMLTRRLREEQDRIRRDRDLRQWQDGGSYGGADPRYWGPPPFPQSPREERFRRRGSRGRSRDSGLGSSTWGSDRTYIS